MKKLGILLITSLCLTSAWANYDFLGTYKCKGYDPYLAKDYSGTVVISQQNTVYRLRMSYDTGEVADGTAGLFDPDTISVVFQDVNDPKKIGLERYSVAKDGKNIEGYWVYLHQDKLGTEVCEKVSSPST